MIIELVLVIFIAKRLGFQVIQSLFGFLARGVVWFHIVGI